MVVQKSQADATQNCAPKNATSLKCRDEALEKGAPFGVS
jgi:hypothetical protein